MLIVRKNTILYGAYITLLLASGKKKLAGEKNQCTGHWPVGKNVNFDLYINELWHLETIGIREPVESLKNQYEHSKIIEKFKTNIEIHPGGRYEVCLPFKSDTIELPINKEMTWKRHKKMRECAEKVNFLIDYENVFREWEDLEIIEKVTGDVQKRAFFAASACCESGQDQDKITHRGTHQNLA